MMSRKCTLKHDCITPYFVADILQNFNCLNRPEIPYLLSGYLFPCLYFISSENWPVKGPKVALKIRGSLDKKSWIYATKRDAKTAIFTSVSVAHLAQMVAFLLDFMTPFIIRRLLVSSQLHFGFLAESDSWVLWCR